jgi:16S rRNA (adenine1518-N6/adenine1519-N6)-dimethyltransferase
VTAGADARALLRRAGLLPKKGFGQNFLVSSHVVEAIAKACVPDAEIGEARVIELGAGLGVLTRALLPRAAKIVAVERDRDLVPILGEELAEAVGNGVLTIVEGDAQATVPAELLPEGPRVLCGNLPYHITGRLLERAVAHADDLARVVFMVQREVADRLAASPGSKEYGALTVFVRAAFRVTKLFDVSPGSFHPPPDVTSAVVRLDPERPRRALETDMFRALVRGAFGMRRKTLRNAWANVAPGDVIERAAAEAKIPLSVRGETLDVDDFARMAAALRQ